MNEFDWSVVTPAVLAAAILSIVLEWFPGVAAWFADLSSAKKTTINALLVAVISIGTVVGRCYLWGSTCPENMWSVIGEVLALFLLAAAGNQAVYAMTRREVLS